MTEKENINAQNIIDRMYEVQDEVIGGFRIAYCRGTDYKGDLNYHNFLAYTDDIVGSDFIMGFSQLIEDYDPDKVELHKTNKHPHLTIGFKNERVSNSPPESKNKFDSLNVSADSGECVRCRRSSPRSYSNLKILRDNTDSKWDTNFDSNEINLCVNCSPSHYDDMTRVINAVCVEDGKVVAVKYGDNQIMSSDDEDFNKILTEGMIKILERDIL